MTIISYKGIKIWKKDWDHNRDEKIELSVYNLEKRENKKRENHTYEII